MRKREKVDDKGERERKYIKWICERDRVEEKIK
jgi:hypothetical protein